METISVPIWTASVTIGMEKAYTKSKIELKDVKLWLRQIQEIQIRREKLFLSANVTLSNIILSGQDEPHVNLNFINYPKFPAPHEKLKQGVLEIAKFMMDKMEQNRIVITFHNEILMMENISEINKDIIQ